MVIQLNHTRNKILVLSTVVLFTLAGGYLYLKYSHPSPAAIHQTTISDIARGSTTKVDGKTTSSTAKLQARPRQIVELTTKEIPIVAKANAAAVSWKQTGQDGVSMQVRTKDNDRWSEWTDIEADDPGKDGAASSQSSALILAKNIDDIQYRFELKGSDTAPSSAVDLTHSSLTAIDTSNGPSARPSLLSSLSSQLMPQAEAAVNYPQIISREQWGNPEPNWSEWTPEYAKLTRVILHHTATTESGDSYADMRAIWYYHAKTLGWGDIGYHYVVDSQGRIFEGRYYDKAYARQNRVEVIGGHAYGNNYGTVGVSMIGNYQVSTPTTQALNSMARITGYKLAPYKIDPSGNGPSGEAVVGHYQVYSTSCPGVNIINQFGYIKNMATQDYAAYLPIFDFDPMLIPRWMRLARDTQKINVDTGQKVDGVLATGKDLKFIDKYLKNGVWYLRTEADFNSYTRKAIPLADIIDITPETLSKPIWLRLNSDRRKWNPVTEEIDYSGLYPAGQAIKFSERINVNGAWHYKTVFDATNNINRYIRGSALDEPAYESFSNPRYMTVTTATDVASPLSGDATGQTIAANTQHLFTSKILLGKAYYRSAEDTATNADKGVSADVIKEVDFTPIEPRWLKLTTDTAKLLSTTLQSTGPAYRSIDFPTIKVAQTYTINQSVYYRTAYDSSVGNGLVFPASVFMEVSYEPMAQPRELTTSTNTNIIDPRTDVVIAPISKGTKVYYDAKITINGVVYLRSKSDSLTGTSRAVQLDKLY